MQPVVAAIVLAAAASACPLHDLADALENGRAAAAPHEWPYAAACAAYANTTEETWCAAGVRNSSGIAALNAWSGVGYGAYRVAEECGAPLPSCFVDADREATAIKLTKLIDWGPSYEDDTLKWDAEMTAICHADIEYWQPHIGAYIGRNEFIEYAYTLSPKFNGASFLHSPIHIVNLAKGQGDWVMTYTWRTAAGFDGETLDGQPEETTILKLGFSETIGEEYKLTYTEFSRPTYEFMSRISMTPETLCTGALAFCPGSLFPYASRRECVEYLSYRVADRCLDGGGGFFAGDTRACRQMHLQLALLEPTWKSNFRLDPIGHCPHLGPDSEKCTAEARSGRRVTAYCDRLAPPHGGDKTTHRPSFAAAGGALAAAAALALLLLLYGERRWRAVVAPATAPRDGLEAASGDGDDSPRSPLSPSPRTGRARLTRSWSVAPLSGMPRDPSLALAPHDAPRVGLVFRDLEVRVDPPKCRASTPYGDGRGRRLLCGAHAAIPPCTMTAILGPSGSGKTTLLRVLCGREASYGLEARGNLSFRVHTPSVVMRRSRRWAAARTSLVALADGSGLPLAASLRLGEQLRYYALVMGVRGGGDDAVRLRRAAAAAREVGLEAHTGTPVGVLSEGQRRRLRLAVRLLAQPSVLALDEPTSGQDAATALALVRGAARLARERTLLVVIHQPSVEVFALFDKVISVRPGGDGVDVATPDAVVAAAAALRLRRPNDFLAANAADIFVEAREALRPLELEAPPALDDDNDVDDGPRRGDAPVAPSAIGTAALALAREIRATSAATLGGYALTSLAIAAIIITIFDRWRAGTTLESTTAAAEVVYVVFISLTTLCGVSNIQANSLMAPAERRRFEDNAPDARDAVLAHFIFVCLRDILVVSTGAAPFALAIYFGCAAGPAARLGPFVVVFMCAQHAFHATGTLFYHVLPSTVAPPDDPTAGLVLSGIYNFLMFLLAGIVKPVRDMDTIWAGAARALPAFNAMALLVNALFAGRDFDCDPLAYSAQCSGGDAVVEIFGFDSIAEHWEKALGIIVVNYVVARVLFLALTWRAARRPAPKPLEDRPSQRFYAVGKAFVELKRRELGNRRRRGDSAAVDDDDGRSPDSVLFGAPRFGARLPARFGDGRSAESEELLSIDGSAPTSPV